MADFDFHFMFLQIESLRDKMKTTKTHFDLVFVKLKTDVALHCVKVG